MGFTACLLLAARAGFAESTDGESAAELLAAQRFAEARALLEPHVAAHPDDTLARCQLAFALVTLGESMGALANADIAAQQQPLWAAPRYHRGRALLLQHDFAGADAAFDAARDRDATWFAEWRDHFQALAALGQGDETRAIRLFTGSPDSKPPGGPPFLFERMAALYSIVPEPEPARAWYRRAATDWFDAEVPGRVLPSFDLAPPVRGEWRVMQGHFGDESHFGIAGSFSLDLMKVEHGKLTRRNGDLREAFFTFDAPVFAPADGRIVHVITDLPDHLARASDMACLATPAVRNQPLGNHLVLALAPDSFLLLAHLRQGSIAWKVGDDVAAGSRLATIGMTGVTYAPHLHLTLWSQLEPPVGRPLRFLGARQRRADGSLAPEAPFTAAVGEAFVVR
ncbi:MAG: hypothetical protein EXS13_01310 [Planctomycetes bacterium]|nr:hypothetical protein [Planctomycetota bacterium]